MMEYVRNVICGPGGDGIYMFITNDRDDVNCHTWIVHRVGKRYRIVQSNIDLYDIGQFCFGWKVGSIDADLVRR